MLAIFDAALHYVKITSGNCTSNGLLPIMTLDVCNAAAAEVGMVDTSASTNVEAGEMARTVS